ncbi:Transcriptional regulator, MerR family [Qipengyuania citrea LAMA 915]|jgi:DNA-binding transcriptional MerR regulator|uniref:Transcriptional regulator, MerR family n=1 Tax=Qipengyuania citrea LAMA 915 TaxID=1306953 RepID=A0A0L1KEA0_9SPHN|nr:MerR family transcriptional regulator [Qipengyuania citrea]KNH02380.1 Transcriptional regulator, MerR family [Qipengyuania citrea LAMA 915]|tara:strand:- start:2499 stop:2867 length:369 start_codon:yes stop_codon:yes gene_type:complete
MAEFDDGKEEGALRTIGEVARATGIKAHVLRYWEQQFPMLKPLTRSGGRRYYRPEDVALVERIDALVNRQGYTLKGAKAALKGAPDPQAAAQAADPRTASVDGDLVARLKSIRADLAAALAA